jgi:hypothetical protein
MDSGPLLARFSALQPEVRPGTVARYLIRLVNPSGAPLRVALRIRVAHLGDGNRPVIDLRQVVLLERPAFAAEIAWECDWQSGGALRLEGLLLPAPPHARLETAAMRPGHYRLTACIAARRAPCLSLFQRMGL